MKPQRQVLTATLHIDCGTNGRPPTATYTCLLCGYTEQAQGRDKVRAFTPHIRTTHRQACPATRHQPEGITAA